MSGKGNIHELGFGVTSNNYYSGPVKNPVDPTLIAGGSSGGAAVAVAAGIAKIGVGVDTFGSCRIPASLCGVYGYRPTTGRYSLKGIVPISYTADAIGLLANNLDDLILADSIITAGWDRRRRSSIDPGHFGNLNCRKKIRLGVCQNYFYEHLSNNVAVAASNVLKQLSMNDNFELVSVDISGIDKCMSSGLDLFHHEISKDLPKFLEEYKTGVSYESVVENLASPDVKVKMETLLECQNVIENDEIYLAALSERSQLIEFYKAIFNNNDIDALIYPTTPVEAKPIEGCVENVDVDGKVVPTFEIYSQNTFPGAFSGMPSISLPLATTCKMLPVGITLEAQKGNDRFLLEIAGAVKDTVWK